MNTPFIVVAVVLVSTLFGGVRIDFGNHEDLREDSYSNHVLSEWERAFSAVSERVDPSKVTLQMLLTESEWLGEQGAKAFPTMMKIYRGETNPHKMWLVVKYFQLTLGDRSEMISESRKAVFFQMKSSVASRNFTTYNHLKVHLSLVAECGSEQELVFLETLLNIDRPERIYKTLVRLEIKSMRKRLMREDKGGAEQVVPPKSDRAGG